MVFTVFNDKTILKSLPVINGNDDSGENLELSAASRVAVQW
jgi:hypothetical protein